MSKETKPRDPTALELQRFNELFARDPLEAVQFAHGRGIAIDADLLSDSHELADQKLGKHDVLRAAADPEVARRALRTKEARFFLANGTTVDDAIKAKAVAAVAASDLAGMESARDLAAEYERPEWWRDCNRQAMALSEERQQKANARGRLIRDSGGKESAERMIFQLQNAERELRSKYGLDSGVPVPAPPERADIEPTAAQLRYQRNLGPTTEQVRSFERELSEARQRIGAEHSDRIARIEAELDKPPPAAA